MVNIQYKHVSYYIVEIILERRRALEDLQDGYVKTSNAPGTQRNFESRKKRYLEFCEYSNIRPYPSSEFKISKFATFLSRKMKTVESVKSYCTTISQEHELRGNKPIRFGLKYYKTIEGIRRALRHTVKRAQPITVRMLEKIERVINLKDQKEMVTWVSTVTGFHLLLRKSNLVPLTRAHDLAHNIARGDIRYHKGVMMVYIRWTKTNQLGELEKSPMVANKYSTICPVRWILYMVKQVPAGPQHNLFSYINDKKQIVPITYRDLLMYIRKWLSLIGVKDAHAYSAHSLRRGSCTHAFEQQISERSIMEMGSWKSQCYKRYIQIGVETKVRNWYQFTSKKH